MSHYDEILDRVQQSIYYSHSPSIPDSIIQKTKVLSNSTSPTNRFISAVEHILNQRNYCKDLKRPSTTKNISSDPFFWVQDSCCALIKSIKKEQSKQSLESTHLKTIHSFERSAQNFNERQQKRKDVLISTMKRQTPFRIIYQYEMRIIRQCSRTNV